MTIRLDGRDVSWGIWRAGWSFGRTEGGGVREGRREGGLVEGGIVGVLEVEGWGRRNVVGGGLG